MKSDADPGTLVLHHGALGDFVLIFPILRACLAGRQRLHLAARHGHVRLAQTIFPNLTGENIDTAAWSALFAPGSSRDAASPIRLLLSQSQRIICFVSNGQDALAAHLAHLAPQAQRYFVQPRPPATWPHHVTFWHRQQLQAQGWELPDVPPQPAFSPYDARKSSLSDSETIPSNKENLPDSRPIIVHPGSGGRDKCWPRERLEALLETLAAEGVAVQTLLGEVECERWPDTAVRRWRDRWQAKVCTDLVELYGHLRQARAYLGNDSGPTHLAAQMGLPTLALFGPTDARVWAPVGPRVRVLAPSAPKSMTWLEVDAVRQALRALVDGGK